MSNKWFKNMLKTNLVVILIFSIYFGAVFATKCTEKPMELRMVNADVIFSGVVRKIDWNNSEKVYSAFVQPYHLIKGTSLINFTNSMSLRSENLTWSSTKTDIWKDLVNIKNFGSDMCDSNVRPGDVRIFLLKFDSISKELTLNSSLIRISPVKIQNFEIISNNFNFNYTKCKI